MRIRDIQGEAEEPFNLIPLTDMAFNLLIFFMAATSFTQLEKDMNVQLPKTAPFQTMSAAPKQLVINIRADGSTSVNGKSYDRPRLAELVKSEIKSNPNQAVLIRGDGKSYWENVAQVAALCHESGMSELKIGLLQVDKK
jgi:biopolymer transport protein ExbD